MQFDLHTHTSLSDGSLDPAELLELASENGVDAIAVTDHDTVDAYHGLVEPTNIELIPGIELSTSWRGIGIHVVGLNIDLRNASLADGIRRQQAARVERAQTIAERLEKIGADPLYARVMERSGGRPGRPDFAAELVESGFVRDTKTAFRRYLGAGKPGDVRQHWASLDEVCQWITDAGGIAVLAHPAKYRLTRTRLAALVKDFIAAGGRAIEVSCGSQDPALTARLARLAEESGLLASCGSDFHHPSMQWSRPGGFSPLPKNVTPVWSAW